MRCGKTRHATTPTSAAEKASVLQAEEQARCEKGVCGLIPLPKPQWPGRLKVQLVAFRDRLLMMDSGKKINRLTSVPAYIGFHPFTFAFTTPLQPFY